MSEDEARARRVQQRLALSAAALRALAARRQLHFRAERLHEGDTALPWFAPHLHPDAGQGEAAALRGMADGLALRLRLSDPRVHAAAAPEPVLERALYESFEQYRVEALVPAHWPGMADNLAQGFEAWTLAYLGTGAAESTRGLTLLALAQMARLHITGQPMPEAAQDPIEAIRAQWLAPRFGGELAALRRLRHDQAAFAKASAALCARLAQAMQAEGQGDDDEAEQQAAAARFFFNAAATAPPPASTGEPQAEAGAGRRRAWQGVLAGYRVFTRAYDEIYEPASRLRPEELAGLRAMLDEAQAQSGLHRARMVRALQAALRTPATPHWLGAQEEGRVDPQRLAQLLGPPRGRPIFRRAQPEGACDACVTLLIDASGSMRRHLPLVAVLADALSRALELAGARCEVLSHGTRAWSGGRAWRDWQRAGGSASAAQPGRLNELSCRIHQSAGQPWRRARLGLAALLHEPSCREGIDGEALAWAAERLGRREEAQRLLIVFSDGCPQDSATVRANGVNYLDAHLRAVAARIEGEGQLALAGVGLGLDLSPYFRQALQWDTDAQSVAAMGHELLTLAARMARGAPVA